MFYAKAEGYPLPYGKTRKADISLLPKFPRVLDFQAQCYPSFIVSLFSLAASTAIPSLCSNRKIPRCEAELRVVLCPALLIGRVFASLWFWIAPFHRGLLRSHHSI